MSRATGKAGRVGTFERGDEGLVEEDEASIFRCYGRSPGITRSAV